MYKQQLHQDGFYHTVTQLHSPATSIPPTVNILYQSEAVLRGLRMDVDSQNN